MQHIQMIYEQGFEVSKTLKNIDKTYFNDDSLRPSIVLSNETDETARQSEQYVMEILYKAEVYRWMRIQYI